MGTDGDHGEQKPLVPSSPKKERPSSCRKFWSFMGPGFLVSIGFLDPGNITSDLESGGLVQYKLLWVLLVSTVFGLVMQRLSARLGVVTQSHLAELCRLHYKRVPRLIIWLMMEVAVVASDMQMVIGLAIAIHLLSNRSVPPRAGVLISLLDIPIFRFLSKHNLEKLEVMFAILIGTMAVAFGYEFSISDPDALGILKGLTTPTCSQCGFEGVLQAVAIVGAIMTPHNLYLHSGLVQSREVDRSKSSNVKEANSFFFLEAVIAVTVSFLINLFVVSVFGKGLYHKTADNIMQDCAQHKYLNVTSTLLLQEHRAKPTLYTGGIFLGCTFGLTAMYIWGVGILSSSRSATMTGTYAGQLIFNGFLEKAWSCWQVSLLLRCISLFPVFCLTYEENLTHASTILNAVMSLQLPFAVIPTVAFTSCSKIMGEFTNSKFSIVLSSVIGLGVVCVNVAFVCNTALIYISNLFLLIPVILLLVIYLVFCVYLCIHAVILFGILDGVESQRFQRLAEKYILQSAL
ncbi:hypothetical protein PPYR_03711 [Photinus pyralis]|uniref:Uncharacterized protein n=1 Tax=Photinus pyralis TaxID=7054 RepID=A0A5N4A3N2_PHOPY|nr:hypothetical protein PPYR_03711 [Photinus pyralis]